MGYYIIIRGPLGCGKTTIAKALAARLSAEYISVDQILADHELEDDKQDGFISEKSFRAANDYIAEIAKPILDAKNPVIVDGNFYWKSQILSLIQCLYFDLVHL